jgi:hypothetical protein
LAVPAWQVAHRRKKRMGPYRFAQHPVQQQPSFVENVHDTSSRSSSLQSVRCERFTRTYPGFVRASVQVSEDRQRVLSHVQWLSKSDCERAFENAEQGEGDMWELIRRHRATSMIFNAYEVAGEVVGPRPR